MYKYKKSFNLKTEFVSTNQVPKYINEIDCNKNSSGDIPAKLIKIAKDEVIAPITNCVDKCILWSTIRDEFKIADIVPLYKIQSVDDKINHQLISLLPIF